MVFKKQLIFREIAGDYMLIPIGETVTEDNGIFMLTPTGAMLYKGLEAGFEREKIISDILFEYDIDEETINKDYDNFISQLKKLEII